jgi:hypothetical protein
MDDHEIRQAFYSFMRERFANDIQNSREFLTRIEKLKPQDAELAQMLTEFALRERANLNRMVETYNILGQAAGGISMRMLRGRC